MTGNGQRLVVGLGSPDRGDDAVGILVARELAALGLPGVQVVEHEDPTDLVDLWAGRRLAVVVDAVRSGGRPGTLLRLETGGHRLPLLDPAWACTGRGSTHAFGLAAAVELSRALHTLPPRLVVIGVEASRFEVGEAMSGPVAAAVGPAVDAVVALVDGEQPPRIGEVASSSAQVSVRRVYDEPASSDGARVLVDRVWPRGLSKERARLDEWCKDVAPSTELRKWYGHDPSRFAEFRSRYLDELARPEQASALAHLAELAGERPLTLLTATADLDISQAAVLAEVLV